MPNWFDFTGTDGVCQSTRVRFNNSGISYTSETEPKDKGPFHG